MHIENHLLRGNGVEFTASPNTGDPFEPGYPDTIVIHFTACRDAGAAISTLTDPERKVSAHLVVGREGAVTQLVPFDTVAWHAGVSVWKGRTALNRFSLGIEVDNAGRLEARDGCYLAHFGDSYPAAETVRAVHRNETGAAYWHAYPESQLALVEELGRLLIGEYGIVEIVGHEEIAPDRKVDPGPAFPLDEMRTRLLGGTGPDVLAKGGGSLDDLVTRKAERETKEGETDG